jgi:hypothetical protein
VTLLLNMSTPIVSAHARYSIRLIR